MNVPAPLQAYHRFVEHTGEVAIELGAASLAELFTEAARALLELIAGDQRLELTGDALRVSVRAHDLGSLLVAWLDELIYLSEVHKLVFPEVKVLSIAGDCLEATVRGATPEYLKTPVKAATLHGLELTEDARGVHAKVVLDV